MPGWMQRRETSVYTCGYSFWAHKLNVHSNPSDVAKETAENLTTVLSWVHFTTLIQRFCTFLFKICNVRTQNRLRIYNVVTFYLTWNLPEHCIIDLETHMISLDE